MFAALSGQDVGVSGVDVVPAQTAVQLPLLDGVVGMTGVGQGDCRSGPKCACIEFAQDAFVGVKHSSALFRLARREKILVLCVDEKSQIQALDRSQPVLPMVPGVPERRSHDHVRAGTTTLSAALEVVTGKVTGSLHPRHRTVEFKKFPAKLDKEVPADLDVHLILDNYVTHRTPAVKKWLPAHPRFHLHFTPTSSS